MTTMTSAQRMATSAQGKEPDRVPLTAMSIDYIWNHLYGPESMRNYAQDEKKLAECMVFACKELQFDSIGVIPDTNFLWEAVAEASGLNYPASYWKGFGAQGPHRVYSGDPLKDNLFGDPLIKDMKDALKLRPPDPYKHGRLPIMIKAIELANKELKGDWGVGGACGHPSWDMALLLGWSQMFMAMKNDLPLWQAVQEVGIQSSYEVAKAQLKAGAKGFSTVSIMPAWVGSETLLKNPVWLHAEHPPEFFVRLYKDFNVKTGSHPCTVGPFEPGLGIWKQWLDHTSGFLMPECGGADAMVRAKKELAPAVIMGNLHPLDVLCHGTPAEVEAGCKELIQKCAPGGRFVLSPGCAIPISAPFENVKAMASAIEKYGYYPIKPD